MSFVKTDGAGPSRRVGSDLAPGSVSAFLPCIIWPSTYHLHRLKQRHEMGVRLASSPLSPCGYRYRRNRLISDSNLENIRTLL